MHAEANSFNPVRVVAHQFNKWTSTGAESYPPPQLIILDTFMKLIPSAELCGLTLICVCSDGGEREQLCMLMPSSRRYRPQRDRSGKNSSPGFEKESPETWTRKLSSSNKWVYRVHEMGGTEGGWECMSRLKRVLSDILWCGWQKRIPGSLLANQCWVHT